MIAHEINAKISIKCLPQFKEPFDKCILVLNHKSYLDFALNFYALAAIRHASGRPMHPRFIAAKDHFIDNPILYSWMGVGKAIEKAGMIFINRKKGQGWAAMAEAAKILMNNEVEIAVFPQGTRALSNTDAQGQHMDAGYYTTYHPKLWNQPLGHLKPGTAHLILDSAIELKDKPIQILFIGILGTGIAGPKGSFKVQTECEFEFRLGPLMDYQVPNNKLLKRPEQKEVQTENEKYYLEEINHIQLILNQNLIENLQVHPHLISQLKKYFPQQISANDQEKIISYLSVHNECGLLQPFIILDRIFALPASTWNQHLHHFCQLILNHSEESTWQPLLKKVSRV